MSSAGPSASGSPDSATRPAVPRSVSGHNPVAQPFAPVTQTRDLIPKVDEAPRHRVFNLPGCEGQPRGATIKAVPPPPGFPELTTRHIRRRHPDPRDLPIPSWLRPCPPQAQGGNEPPPTSNQARDPPSPCLARSNRVKEMLAKLPKLDTSGTVYNSQQSRQLGLGLLLRPSSHNTTPAGQLPSLSTTITTSPRLRRPHPSRSSTTPTAPAPLPPQGRIRRPAPAPTPRHRPLRRGQDPQRHPHHPRRKPE